MFNSDRLQRRHIQLKIQRIKNIAFIVLGVTLAVLAVGTVGAMELQELTR